MPGIGTSGSMSGDGKRSAGLWPQATAPILDSTVPFRQADRDMVASLHQARAIDYRRLSTKLGQLDDSDFDRVREGFWKLYK
jgi:hypothetical protein